MDKVQFINIEDGDDLILSFSFKEGTKFGVDGFMLHRCPKYEFALMPHERGPSVTWIDDDEFATLASFELSRDRVVIQTRHQKYTFDISGLSEQNIKSIRKIVRKMNFDHYFEFIERQS